MVIELLETLYDNVLKKCGNGKMKDDHIEGLLGKDVKLVEYANEQDLFA